MRSERPAASDVIRHGKPPIKNGHALFLKIWELRSSDLLQSEPIPQSSARRLSRFDHVKVTAFCRHAAFSAVDSIARFDTKTTRLQCYVIDMKFSHLIQVNDPLDPSIKPLTRDQLWRGLVLRASSPKLFVPWLDACNIVHRSVDALDRELRYGEVAIRDHVTFSPQMHVHYQVPAQKDIPSSRLNVTIEEPQPGLLSVRFDYDDESPDIAGTTEAFYNEFRRSAYQEADLDTVRIIRQLSADDQLA